MAIDDPTSILWIKIAALVSIFVISFVFAILPFLGSKVKRCQKITQTIFLYLNTLAAGAIIGAAFMHMLPEGQENMEIFFEAIKPENHTIVSSTQPFVKKFARSIAFSIFKSSSVTEDGDGGQITSVAEYPWSPLIICLSCLLLLCIDRIFSFHSHGNEEHAAHHEEEPQPPKFITPTQSFENNDASEINNYQQSEESNHLLTPNSTLYPKLNNSGETNPVSTVSANTTTTASINSSSNNPTTVKRTSNILKFKLLLTSFTTVLALSVHSVFEAFPIGLSNEIESLLHVFVPVVLHKGFEAITCGVIIQEFTYGKGWFQLFAVLQIAIYAASTPIGMGVGMALAQVELGAAYYLLAGILLSLATGSFIFIACFEIIPLALKDAKSVCSRLFMMFLIFFGFSIMSVLAIFG